MKTKDPLLKEIENIAEELAGAGDPAFTNPEWAAHMTEYSVSRFVAQTQGTPQQSVTFISASKNSKEENVAAGTALNAAITSLGYHFSTVAIYDQSPDAPGKQRAPEGWCYVALGMTLTAALGLRDRHTLPSVFHAGPGTNWHATTCQKEGDLDFGEFQPELIHVYLSRWLGRPVEFRVLTGCIDDIKREYHYRKTHGIPGQFGSVPVDRMIGGEFCRL